MQQHTEHGGAQQGEMAHSLRAEDRTQLYIGGVTDVDSFDEETVKVVTVCGVLTVCGAGLHIEQLQLESGELRLTGKIDSLAYSDRQARRGRLGRLFR